MPFDARRANIDENGRSGANRAVLTSIVRSVAILPSGAGDASSFGPVRNLASDARLADVLLDPCSFASIACRARCTALVRPDTASLACLLVGVGHLS